MNARRPKPPVPPDVDLRDFRFMPLDVVQLMNSETWALAGTVPGASRALINLWARAWHQVPAGSLPNNEAVLSGWSGVANWSDVRDIALRGFVESSDGRLYHKSLCEKVCEASERNRKTTKRATTAAQSRWKHKKTLKKTDNAQALPEHENHHAQASENECSSNASRARVLTGTGTGTGISKERSLSASKESADDTLLEIPTKFDRRRGTRLPDDWQLDDQLREMGTAARSEHGLPDVDLDLEAAKFRDYWHGKSGRDACKRDWPATWRNWCRKADAGPATPKLDFSRLA